MLATIVAPRTSLGFIDRFLVTAEAYQIPAKIVFNKKDLLDEEMIELQNDIIKLYTAVIKLCVFIYALLLWLYVSTYRHVRTEISHRTIFHKPSWTSFSSLE